MRQERIRRTPRRRRRQTDSSQPGPVLRTPDTGQIEIVLQRIDQLLEVA
jgi:hypothetical protein